MITIHWKALLAAFFLFVTGIAVGILGTVGFGVRQMRATLHEPAAHGRFDRALGRVENRLVRELDLDAAQAAMVHRELARSGQELRAQRTETAQRNRRTIAAAVIRIGAELPPEKRAELRRLVRQRLGRLGLDLTDTDSEVKAPPALPER